jgi:O-antigen/teichoic acid export membrane protein
MLKNGLYNIIGAVIRVGITFLTIPVIIRLMGVEEYGLWTLVSTVIGIVGLAEGGLSISTTVFLSRDLANEDVKGISQTLTVIFCGMLILATMAAMGLWLGADSLLMFFPKIESGQRTQALQALQIGGLVVWTRLLQQVFVGMEQAYQCYGVMNLFNTLQICFTNVMMMLVAWQGGDITKLMLCHAIASFGGLLGHSCVGCSLVWNLKLRPTWDSKKFISVASYSSMTWLTTLGSALFSQCDRLIVGGILGTKILGVYAAITNITGQINSFSALPIQPLLPKLSNLFTKGESNVIALHKQLKQALQVNSLVALGLGGGLMTLTPLIMNIIIPNSKQNEYNSLFQIAIIIYSLYSINAVGYYVLFSIDAVNLSLKIQLFSGIISLSLIAVFAYYFGLFGAIIGNSGYLCVWFLNISAMKKLKIPVKIWVNWVLLFLLWFLAIVLINIYILVNTKILTWNFLVLVIQSVIILATFLAFNPSLHPNKLLKLKNKV